MNVNPINTFLPAPPALPALQAPPAAPAACITITAIMLVNNRIGILASAVRIATISIASLAIIATTTRITTITYLLSSGIRWAQAQPRHTHLSVAHHPSHSHTHLTHDTHAHADAQDTHSHNQRVPHARRRIAENTSAPIVSLCPARAQSVRNGRRNGRPQRTRGLSARRSLS